MKTKLLPLLLLLTLVSCQGESKRNRKLKIQVKQACVCRKVLARKLSFLYRDLKKMWLQSLQYRFPDVVKVTGQMTELNKQYLAHQKINFLKSICIEYLGNGKVKAIYTFLAPQAVVRPQFILYLFDKEGNNIWRQEITFKSKIKWKFWEKRGVLPADKEITQETKFTMYEPFYPYYLLIRKKS